MGAISRKMQFIMKLFYILGAVLIILASMYSCSKEEASRCGENALFVTDAGDCFCKPEKHL
jgi:hypothetical protein